jgi:hypothetical protein
LTFHVRLLGAFIAGALGAMLSAVIVLIVGLVPPGVIVATSSGVSALVGGWLAPKLVNADRVRMLAVGVVAGIAPVPLFGVMAAVVGIGQSVVEGRASIGELPNIIGALLLSPLVFVALFGVTSLVAFLPAGLVWAALTQRIVRSRDSERASKA